MILKKKKKNLPTKSGYPRNLRPASQENFLNPGTHEKKLHPGRQENSYIRVPRKFLHPVLVGETVLSLV